MILKTQVCVKKGQKNNLLSAKSIATSLFALTMGLWLDQLVDAENFNRNEAKKISINHIKNYFPNQLNKY